MKLSESKTIDPHYEKIMTAWALKAGTESNPIRYARIDADDPDREAKRLAQLAQFSVDAKAGKVLCLSDLMINAGM